MESAAVAVLMVMCAGTPRVPVHLHAVDFGVAPIAFDAAAAAEAPAPAPRLDVSAVALPAPQQGGLSAPPPRAFVYSEAYQKRDHIHHLASYAMLPLFGAEAYLGQYMFNHPADIGPGLQNAHRAMAWGVAGLFGVNTVTGLWNLNEARKDPNGLGRRMVHATLMLVADSGFLATAMTKPNSRTANGLAIYTDKKNQHMTLAYASISTATVGYLIMLLK